MDSQPPNSANSVNVKVQCNCGGGGGATSVRSPLTLPVPAVPAVETTGGAPIISTSNDDGKGKEPVVIQFGQTVRFVAAGVIGTLILVVWSVALTTAIQKIFKLGESVRDSFLVAIIATILGIVVLKLLKIDVKAALGPNLESGSVGGGIAVGD
jgi:hypothetical protein